MVVSTTQYILLPDGTYAALVRSMTYGEAAVILLLVAVVFMLAMLMWRQRPPQQPIRIVVKDTDADGPSNPSRSRADRGDVHR